MYKPPLSPGGAYVVLTWSIASRVDLYVTKGTEPVASDSRGSKYVYFGENTMGGVQLEFNSKASAAAGGGLAWVHFAHDLGIGSRFRVAANLFSQSDNGEIKCVPFEDDCQFRGLERIELFDQWGSVGAFTLVGDNTQEGDWWFPFTVFRESTTRWKFMATDADASLVTCGNLFLGGDGDKSSCPVWPGEGSAKDSSSDYGGSDWFSTSDQYSDYGSDLYSDYGSDLYSDYGSDQFSGSGEESTSFEYGGEGPLSEGSDGLYSDYGSDQFSGSGEESTSSEYGGEGPLSEGSDGPSGGDGPPGGGDSPPP